ncbi:MAG: carboxypeptidase regulatory-like domain-containing protein, partial [Deltaproteobacteria bacterium]|nr:carboxypeptidase regulatory-like domain-containing protein [Deltaproteobacteria bacterium]
MVRHRHLIHRYQRKAGLAQLLFGRGFLRLFIMAMLSALAANLASAEVFKIRVEHNGSPLAGVSIYGTHGVKHLPGRTTDSNGEWSVDTSQLASSSFVVTYTHVAGGYRFEPPEVAPSLQACPGKVCKIKAIADGNTAAVIEWHAINSDGSDLANQPLIVPGAEVACPKFTDPDGYAVFAVKKRGSSCSDADASLDNNYYKVMHLPVRGRDCSFTNSLLQKFNICPTNASQSGYSIASCANVNDLPVGASVNYQIWVQRENGANVSGISFMGHPALENTSTNALGKIAFSTLSIGAAPNDTISLIPYGYGYQFQPARLDISPNSCPNNICKVTAFSNGAAQGVIRWNASEEGAAKSGVSIGYKDYFACSTASPIVTDAAGRAYAPAIVRTACDMADSNRGNDLSSFTANLADCTFTHDGQTPFQLCPTAAINDVFISAFCGGAVPSQRRISGVVFDRDGYPLPSAKIFNGGMQVATTDTNGRYNVFF